MPGVVVTAMPLMLGVSGVSGVVMALMLVVGRVLPVVVPLLLVVGGVRFVVVSLVLVVTGVRSVVVLVVGRVLPVVVTLVFVAGRVRSAVVARVIILVTVASDCSLVPSRLHVYLFRQKTRSQIPMTSQLSPGPGRSGLAECQYLKPSFAGSCVAPALDERVGRGASLGADTYLPDHGRINHRPVTAFLCYFTPFHAPTIRYE